MVLESFLKTYIKTGVLSLALYTDPDSAVFLPDEISEQPGCDPEP